MAASDATRPLTVLQSFRRPRPTTNPYLSLLLASLPDEVQTRTFSWPRALLGRYDVLHLHWPEVVLRGTTPSRTAARRALFALLLARAAVRHTAVVRTVHNPAPHESGSRTERKLLALTDRMTTLAVHLTPGTEGAVRADLPVHLIPHGHYRDWYCAAPGARPVTGRLLHFGLLRPYKNVEGLLDAVRESGDDLTLRIVGAVTARPLQQRIVEATTADRRITADLRHVPDDDLVQEIQQCELVVLPYSSLQNSGALLLALSLDRPVLVPDNPVTSALAEEVGPGWVHTFYGGLCPADIQQALTAVRSEGRSARPDLSARGWSTAGTAHRDAYRRAMALPHR